MRTVFASFVGLNFQIWHSYSIKIKHLIYVASLRILQKKKWKKWPQKAEKKEKRKPILTGVWNGLVKVFDSKILPDIQGIIRLDEGEFLSE